MRKNWRGWLIVLLAAASVLVLAGMLLHETGSGQVRLRTKEGNVQQVLSEKQEEDPAELPEKTGWICINTADARQLQLLPDVGPKLAENIVTYRKKIGAFISLEQIMDVPGLGEKTFERIRNSICLEDETQ